MSSSQHALAALRDSLSHPDAVVPLDGAVSPVAVAVATTGGLLGTGCFLALFGTGLASVGGSTGGTWWTVLPVPLAVGALSLPPLYLVTVLQGRVPDLLRLCAVASSGPTVAGAWLGALSPLLALFLFTGEIDPAFVLLGAVGMVLAAVKGAVASWCNTLRAGRGVPTGGAMLIHYGFTAWTAVVISLHLLA